MKFKIKRSNKNKRYEAIHVETGRLIGYTTELGAKAKMGLINELVDKYDGELVKGGK